MILGVGRPGQKITLGLSQNVGNPWGKQQSSFPALLASGCSDDVACEDVATFERGLQSVQADGFYGFSVGVVGGGDGADTRGCCSSAAVCVVVC